MTSTSIWFVARSCRFCGLSSISAAIWQVNHSGLYFVQLSLSFGGLRCAVYLCRLFFLGEPSGICPELECVLMHFVCIACEGLFYVAKLIVGHRRGETCDGRVVVVDEQPRWQRSSTLNRACSVAAVSRGTSEWLLRTRVQQWSAPPNTTLCRSLIQRGFVVVQVPLLMLHDQLLSFAHDQLRPFYKFPRVLLHLSCRQKRVIKLPPHLRQSFRYVSGNILFFHVFMRVYSECTTSSTFSLVSFPPPLFLWQ